MTMQKYDYFSTVCADVRDFIKENINAADFSDREKLEEHLNDVLWAEDSVTGNASGSYTFNAYEAEENLCHNLDLLKEAYDEFGGTPNLESPETCDVTIRCYLLGSAIAEVLNDMEEELFPDDN